MTKRIPDQPRLLIFGAGYIDGSGCSSGRGYSFDGGHGYGYGQSSFANPDDGCGYSESGGSEGNGIGFSHCPPGHRRRRT